MIPRPGPCWVGGWGLPGPQGPDRAQLSWGCWPLLEPSSCLACLQRPMACSLSEPALRQLPPALLAQTLVTALCWQPSEPSSATSGGTLLLPGRRHGRAICR